MLPKSNFINSIDESEFYPVFKKLNIIQKYQKIGEDSQKVIFC